MPNLQSPRGTRDLLPADQPYWQLARSTAQHVAEQLGFKGITTPMYEDASLFQRSLGEATDVMEKELFLVKGIRSEDDATYALRPEGTAGVVRAFIEHGMHTWPQPVKLYYLANNFRYDRPQRGRYREHTQFGVEYFGSTHPFADAWVIYTTWKFLTQIGIRDLNLQLNTLGTAEERTHYLEALVAYLTPLRDQLSEDSQRRLGSNPLRILDSKEAQDQDVIAQAPQLKDFLTEASQAHYQQVRSYLDTWQIPYQENTRLVRGLDYYVHTAFEWTTLQASGQQASLGGGGRYDGLVASLGGPSTGAVGAGIGLDRVIETLQDQGTTLNQTAIELFVVAGEAQQSDALTVINQLIDRGWSVDAALDKANFSNQLKLAARSEARAALIIGEEEVAQGSITVKDLVSGEQTMVPRDQILDYLREHYVTPCACCS